MPHSLLLLVLFFSVLQLQITVASSDVTVIDCNNVSSYDKLYTQEIKVLDSLLAQRQFIDQSTNRVSKLLYTGMLNDSDMSLRGMLATLYI